MYDVIRSLSPSTRYRFWYGNPETGKAWPEECDVIGYVAYSTGPKKIPLIVYRRSCFGGVAILVENVVRIATTKGHVVYEHPNLDLGEWEIKDNGPEQDLRHDVYMDGILIARFQTSEKARRYVDFMLGKRFRVQ